MSFSRTISNKWPYIFDFSLSQNFVPAKKSCRALSCISITKLNMPGLDMTYFLPVQRKANYRKLPLVIEIFVICMTADTVNPSLMSEYYHFVRIHRPAVCIMITRPNVIQSVAKSPELKHLIFNRVADDSTFYMRSRNTFTSSHVQRNIPCGTKTSMPTAFIF